METYYDFLTPKVVEKASALPEDIQELVAEELQDEIEWETRWDQTLVRSQEPLDKLTEKAMKEYAEGRTEDMGFDEL